VREEARYVAEGITEFGVVAPGAVYRLRPGGYVVLLRGGMIGVVATPVGLVLPGGGQEDGESAEAAAVRETVEECGLRVTLGRCIGVADELVFAAEDGVHYRKRCTFFLSEAAGRCGGGEPDHELIWLPIGDANRLRFGSQRWAVAEAVRTGHST
jgi:8-oxo-dGTP pyrophosphatase MutT (NUDIX family)